MQISTDGVEYLAQWGERDEVLSAAPVEHPTR